MKIKKTYKYYITALFLFAAFNETFAQQIVDKGNLNLKNYSFQKQGIFELNGTWEFYPGKLYSPKDFSSKSVNKPIYVNVPSLWDTTFFTNNENPNIGFGTYRLHIVFPDDVELLAIRLERIETAYTLWLNDEKFISSGRTGPNKKLSKPAQKTLFKIFPINKKSLFLTLQVSNFHHRKGGIDDSIIIGLPAQIITKTKSKRGINFFIIGVLLIMAVFHFGLYVVKRNDNSLLFFGLFLLSEIISMIVNGEVTLTRIFPDLSWAALKKIDYISNFIRSSFFALFFYKLYEQEISKLYVKIIVGINIVLTIIVLFTNLQFYSFTLIIFIITSSLTLFYILYAQIKSILKKKEGAWIPFIGTIALLITVINDILFVSDIIDSIYLTPFGLFIFIFSQAYILSFNFSNLYRKAEELNKVTADLDHIKNKLLEKRSFKYVDSLQILTEHTGATRGILFSVSDNKPIFKSDFPEKNDDTGISEKYPKNLIKSVIDEQKINIIPNISSGASYNKSYIEKFNIKSSICIPFSASGKIRAILYLESNKRNSFNKHESEVFSHLSDQIIGIIDNINMFKELENSKLNLEKNIKNRTKDVRNQNKMLEEQKVEIDTINTKLVETFNETKLKNKVIKDSIVYAKYLQDVNFPEKSYIDELFPDNFILNRPKEILSGDFYWAKKKQTENENIIFALADCTGHGVPGSLISVIGIDLLNNITINQKIKKPSEILNTLQKEIKERFGGDDSKVKDGMEMAIISYDKEKNLLEYSGAKINLIIFRNYSMTEIVADKVAISAFKHERIKERKFTNHKIHLKKNDTVYLFTDGYQDQFGGKNDTKFMKKNFRALLKECNDLQFPIQRNHLLKTLNRWQGKNIQNDDILVVGFKF